MNKLAIKIKELPVEMITEILNHTVIHYYVSVYYDTDFLGIHWYDNIEDALSYYFLHCKKVWFGVTDNKDFYFEFGTNKHIYSINAYDVYDVDDIKSKLNKFEKTFVFNKQEILDRLKLDKPEYCEKNILDNYITLGNF